MKYVIGTRGSKLARIQAEYVRKRLAETYTEEEFEIQIIKTKGDLILDKPLHEIGDKGVFVREIEEKLLSGEIHIGVHSMKDMPAFPADGLLFTKAWKREDPRDVLILREKKSLYELSEGAVIGTGSRRREIQLKKLRPDIYVTGIRGNIETRLRKMEEEKLDGIVLAAAGLHRLGMEKKITGYLDTEEMIPAPAQGILALEIRKGEQQLLKMLDALCDADTVQAAEAERGFLQEIGGNCRIPVGAVCRQDAKGNLQLDVMFGNESGTKTAYASVCGRSPANMAKQAAALIRQQLAGTVSLVGAGPGDPGLITIRGLHAIQNADCIVYDRLVSPQLLKEAKSGCEMIYVGKENHNHTMKQEDINRLLVNKSMKYERVVRLKGGDVYVFGRGGEEGIFLRAHGVPFEVIPGISSCIAGPAYAGIPVTHRGLSLGFHVVTAHDRNDALADIDFEAMAKGKETCIFLMGLSKTKEIADRLIKAGMQKNTKAAVISHAAASGQKICVSDLFHIAEEAAAAGLTSPAVIVVGDVVSLQEELDFLKQRPLFEKRYLIPKIGEKTVKLKELLEARGAEADEIQVGAIVKKEIRFTKEQLNDVDWLVFTSGNGVEAFFDSFFHSGLDIRSLAGCRIAAIGEKTARILKSYGICADLIPDKFDSDALADNLFEWLSDWKNKNADAKRSCRVWYLKAEHADRCLKERLKEICEFEEIAVYENRTCKPDTESIHRLTDYDGVLFTCASSVHRLTKTFRGEWEDSIVAYSIGAKTTECLRSYGVSHILEAENASYEALAELCVAEAERKIQQS